MGLAFIPVEGPPEAAQGATVLQTPSQPAPVRDGQTLRGQLAELARLRGDGVLTAAEHKRKRADLVAAWGLPPRKP